MPRRIKELIYYDTDRFTNFRTNAHGKKQCERPKNTLVKLPVSSALMAFERDKHIQAIDEQLRKNPVKDSDKVYHRIIQSFIAAERRDKQNREQNAQTYLLNNLKKEKYG